MVGAREYLLITSKGLQEKIDEFNLGALNITQQGEEMRRSFSSFGPMD